MADISRLSRFVGGVIKGVDISSNTLVVQSIKVGGGVSNTELTKAILDKLVSLQNGSDVDATYHTHDGRYFTESELGSSTASSGSDLIGDDATYSNFTPAAATVKGALSGIDAALAATADEKVGITAADTTPGYLAAKIQVDNGSNTTNPLEESILTPGGDETFRIRFDQTKVDHGSIAGLGDDDHTIYTKADGTRAFTGNQSFGGFKATNLADPVSAQDAVTLAYLQARENGLKPKQSVRVASSSNIVIASALEAGDIVDGITLAEGDRVLLYGQTLPEQNGIYVAVAAAAGAASRSTDMDSLTPVDEVNRSWVPVQEGTHAGKVFVQYGTVATLGTDPVNFEFYDALANLVGGDMIAKSGSTLSVDLLTNGGLKSSNPGNVGGQLQVSLEASNPTLEVNGSNELKAKLDAAGAISSGASGLKANVDNSTVEIATNALQVKDGGISLAKMASNSVDENKIVSTTFSATGAVTGGGGSKIAVQVDGSSIEINTNALRVKSTAFDQATITGGSGSAAAVQYSPKIGSAEVAGEAFSAATLYAVRYAQDAETAGRVYKADKAAATTPNYNVIGLMLTVGALSATDATPVVVKHGAMTVTSHGFTVGKPVYLDASGALSSTPSATVDDAVVKVGMIKDVNTIDVQIQFMYIV